MTLAEIEIPFQTFFQLPMASGEKTCTSRTKQYGKIGDTFRAFDCLFEIVRIEQRTLKNVQVHLWKQEGCSSPEEFRQIWNMLHPYKKFQPWQMVYVHHFRRVPENRGVILA